ncbi:MAG: hypothetical protein EAZ55_08890 [Cytophagales bacterium]|nr:MAG: hypothetical protein EAZ55_08890 [Cytophagales bacterium]
MHLRRNTAIAIYNSVFVGYPEGLRLDGTATYANFNGTATTTGASNATLQGITFSNMSADYKEAGGTLFADIKTYFETATRKNNPAASTTVASLLLNANAFTLGSAADFRPQSTSPLVTNANTATVPTGLTQTTYRGAFDATTNWTSGWANFDPQNADY